MAAILFRSQCALTDIFGFLEVQVNVKYEETYILKILIAVEHKS